MCTNEMNMDEKNHYEQDKEMNVDEVEEENNMDEQDINETSVFI